MKLYICEICGDAYIGEEKPGECPFCGAPRSFIKEKDSARPIINETGEIGEVSRQHLMETYNLEVKAAAIYNCMAGKARTYPAKAMFKRLAKIELEHAVIVAKLLSLPAPAVGNENCSDEDRENFRETIDLETNASSIYKKFLSETEEERIKKLFTALFQVETGHIELMKNFI